MVSQYRWLRLLLWLSLYLSPSFGRQKNNRQVPIHIITLSQP